VYGRAPEMLELTDTLLSCAAVEACISTKKRKTVASFLKPRLV
jgi:hypothetical protein